MVFEELETRLKLDKSDVSQGLDEAESDVEGFADRASDIGGSMQSAGMKMSAGITAPIAGLAALSVNTASDIEEMQAKSEAVFGELTGDVREWADATADEMGRSRFQLEKMASGFQDLLVPMGATREEGKDMSQQLTEMSQDLSSFNNIPAEKVQEDLQSALTGSSETMKKYGVDVSAAAVNQELLNQGIEGGREEATRMQEAQARMAIITRETADAQGNAAETSSSFANQMRAAKADTKEMRAEIGQHLLPIAKALVQRLSGLVGWFGSLSDRQQKVVIVVAGLAAALGPLLVMFGTLLTMLPMMASGFALLTAATAPVSLPILAIVAAIGLLAAAVATDFMGIRSTIVDVANRIREVLGALLGWLVPIWKKHFGAIAKEVKLTAQAWKRAILGFVEWARPYVDAFLSTISKWWGEHGDTVMSIIRPLLNGIKRLFTMQLGMVRDVLVGFIRLARGDWEGAKESFLNIGRRLAEGVVDLFKWLKKRLIGGSVIPSMLSDILGAVRSFNLGAAFRSALGGALRRVRRLTSNFRSAGRALASSVASGIRSRARSARRAASSLASAVRSRLPGSDADEGPLSDLTKAGEALPETFAEGIERRTDRVAGASNTVAGEAKPRPAAGAGAGSLERKLDDLIRAVEDSGGDVRMDGKKTGEVQRLALAQRKDRWI